MIDYSKFKNLKVEKDEKVAIITLNQPDKLNVFDGPMHHERVLFGDVGRDKIRRRSVEKALALLGALF